MLEKVEHKTLCQIKDLGFIDYPLAYHIQEQTVREVIEGGVSTLLICEHPPIFTLGRLATEDNILLPKSEIENKEIKILRINRGGEITFHGPGQLVIYPILQLKHLGKDLKFYMDQLEQVAIDLLERFDIVANRIPGERGVWVKTKKIASIGIGVRKWVSFHGMAINVNTELRYFSMIKPCGLDVKMTSMAEIKGRTIDLNLVKEEVIKSFVKNFGLDLMRRN